MSFILPNNADDAQRLEKIVLRLAALPLGKELIKSLQHDRFDEPTPDVHLAFDRQMGSMMGMCQRTKEKTTISLHPDMDDATLVSVLAHEICHVPQPRKPLMASAEGMTSLALACNRMMEADAFTHQFVVALGSNDDEVKRATMNAVCGRLSPEVQQSFADLATRWESATNTTQQQAVLNDVFWMVQATRLGSYDSEVIEGIKILQQGNTLTPMSPSVADRTSSFIADIQYLPGRLPGMKYNDYLGDDPGVVAQRLLRVADVAQMLHDPVSVINHDSTLPYSKPPRHDSVKHAR